MIFVNFPDSFLFLSAFLQKKTGKRNTFEDSQPHFLSSILYALSGQPGSWTPFMHFWFHPFSGQRRDALPRGKRLHFRLLSLLLALAGRFVLEVRASASSFLEMACLA